jgi:hypothetical protein
LTAAIEALGGKFSAKITMEVTHLISTEATIKKSDTKIDNAHQVMLF